jgi:hypothetical protein
VQRFAPTLREHTDAGMTESMAVDAAVIDPIPNAQQSDDDRCKVVQSDKRLRPDVRQNDPPSFSPAAVAIFMQNASMPASRLAALAAVSSMFRFRAYSDSDVNRHVRTNVWCRTPEYAAALADALCNHADCHCRLQFQQVPAALRRERLASIVPFHVNLQRCYDERYGYHNGCYLDSPSEREAVLRQLRVCYPELAPSYSPMGRLSLASLETLQSHPRPAARQCQPIEGAEACSQ